MALLHLSSLSTLPLLVRDDHVVIIYALPHYQKVFNTANDTANLLAAYDVALSGSGDVDHMSIGGPPGDLAPITEKLLRNVTGLSSTHVSFESDASPTRGDLYQ
jgi:hypothetical protein